MLECITLDPPSPATACVIWMHGLGADGNDFVPMVPELNLPRDHSVRFVFPNAPTMPVTINGGCVMRAWYDIVSAELDKRADETGVRTSAVAIDQLITVGPLGLHPSTLLGGFDIEAGTGTAYASFTAVVVSGFPSVSMLHTINFATGAATPIGLIGSGASIDGIAIAPTLSTCLDLDGDGLALPLTDGLMLLRALLGLTGAAVTCGALPWPTPPRSTWTDIRAHLNANCGMRFGP